MIRRMGKNRARWIVLWALFLFAFTTLTHEATCREEPAGLCQALHRVWSDPACSQPDSTLTLRPFGACLIWNQGPVVLPDFIKNIFHPPD